MDWKLEHPKYDKGALLDEVPATPWILWKQWQEDAKREMRYTNEIVLATADAASHPSARMLLLKYASEEKGFCWFSNRQSKKGRDLSENPQAQILWYSRELQRQVRIFGSVSELDRSEVVAYARSRPRGSQISAYISKQSRIIASRKQLQTEYAEAEEAYKDGDVPVSEEWTGYALYPETFEFWQGSSDRLHDRIWYVRDNDVWSSTRLYP